MNRIKYVYKSGPHVHTVVLKQPNGDEDPRCELFIDGTYVTDIDMVSLARQAVEHQQHMKIE